MPENFNPYHQWLGLGQQAWSPDPYQLLCLTPGETDVARITFAAEQAQNRLRSHSPGPNAAEWTRLHAEIETAKRSLIAFASAQGNAAPATGGSHRPAPRVKTPVANSAPQAYSTAAPAPGTVPMAAPVYPQANPAIPRAVPVQPVAPVPARRTKTAVKARRARKSNNLIALAGIAGGLMLVAAVVLLIVVMLQTREDDRDGRNRVAAVNPPPIPATPRPTPRPDNASRRSPPAWPETPAVPPEPADGATDSVANSGTPDDADPFELLQPTEVPTMFGQDVVGNPPPSPVTAPSDPGLSPVPLPTPVSPAPGGATPTPQQVQELSRALTAARTALEDGQFEEALTQLAGAERLPMLPDHLERYQRLQLLVQYARNFRTELSRAISSLSGTDEIPVGTSTVVGVVETNADRITVRVAGANRTYEIDELPVGLAIAIADLHLAKSDPVSLVVKAAHLASRKDVRADQLARARDWFREAKQNGADIGDLEKVLDDSYQLTP